MKRDMELVRTILKEIEDKLEPGSHSANLAIDGYDAATVAAHIELLIEADLIKGRVARHIGGISATVVERLTWTGHDFVDVARDQIWKKAKESVLKHGASITFDLLLEWLKLEARKHLPMP
jgi:Hypothetical protein (DUF2513)